MNEEQRKEIVKAFFYGHTAKEIAEIEEVSEEEVSKAVRWGEESGYTDELRERWEELNEE